MDAFRSIGYYDNEEDAAGDYAKAAFKYKVLSTRSVVDTYGGLDLYSRATFNYEKLHTEWLPGCTSNEIRANGRSDKKNGSYWVILIPQKRLHQSMPGRNSASNCNNVTLNQQFGLLSTSPSSFFQSLP